MGNNRPIGKITIDELKNYILPFTGVKDPNVVVGPGVGEDAAIVNFKGEKLILKTDPVSCALNRIGWLVVNVNANDIATKGGVPKWFLVSLILPTTYTGKDAGEIMRQIHEASLKINVAVVGGHTEFIGGLTHPIAAGAMIGVVEADNIFSVKKAQVGDYLVLTKTAGIEGTSIIATDLEEELKPIFSIEFIERAKNYIKNLSIVEEAKIAKSIPGVTAMHDCTEGGVITAAYEVAEASGNGLILYKDKIPVSEETRKLTEYYQLDPIEIISSGALIIAINKKYVDSLIEKLERNGIPATVIGQLREKAFGRKIKKGETTEEIKIPEADPLWRLFDSIVKHRQ